MVNQRKGNAVLTPQELKLKANNIQLTPEQMDFLEICAHGNIFNEKEEAILRCQSVEEANHAYLPLEEAIQRCQSEEANQPQATEPSPYAVPTCDKCLTRGLAVVLEPAKKPAGARTKKKATAKTNKSAEVTEKNDKCLTRGLAVALEPPEKPAGAGTKKIAAGAKNKKDAAGEE